MNKKFLAILIGIFVLLLILIIPNFFIINSETSDTFKTMNFDGITVSVPSNSNFGVDDNFYNDFNHGIYILTYSDDTDQKFVNETVNSFIKDNNLTEIHVDNVSSNIFTFISEDSDDPSIYAIVVNDNKDKAIIIFSNIDTKLAIKIAKTVKF